MFFSYVSIQMSLFQLKLFYIINLIYIPASTIHVYITWPFSIQMSLFQPKLIYIIFSYQRKLSTYTLDYRRLYF